MTSREFVYWLQGFFELNESDIVLSAKQIEIIKQHLNLVFTREIYPQKLEYKQKPTQKILKEAAKPIPYNNPPTIPIC